MASNGTADNMTAAVARLTESRGLRGFGGFREIDPFGPLTGPTAVESPSDDGSAIAPAPARGGNGRARRANGKARRKPETAGSLKLKRIAAPVLLLLAAGLIVPGVWSVLVFAGANVALSDKESAKPMAAMMLVCWPLAVCLALIGGWMIRDLLASRDA